MANAWKYDRAKDAIEKRINDVKTVTIVDWTRDTSLESIPTNQAYRMKAVHLYVEIPNLREILNTTAIEGTLCRMQKLTAPRQT